MNRSEPRCKWKWCETKSKHWRPLEFDSWNHQAPRQNETKVYSVYLGARAIRTPHTAYDEYEYESNNESTATSETIDEFCFGCECGWWNDKEVFACE